jgi:hypothetical protein
MDERALTLPPDVLYGLLAQKATLVGLGRTFYVSATGSDSNSGTSPGSPWQTVTKVNGFTFLPGDRVLFNGGDNFSGVTLTPGQSGTQAAPITFGSYGNGRATITMTTNDAVFIWNKSWITIQDLILVGSSAGTAFSAHLGIDLFSDSGAKSTGIIVANCDASQYQHGLGIGAAATASGWSNVTVTNCDFHGNRDNGIITYNQTAWTPGSPAYANSNITITNTRCYSNLGNSANTTGNTGSGIQLGNVNTATISGCTAYSNGSNNGFVSGGPVGIWCFTSTNVTITNCLSYSNRSGTAADGDGFDIDVDCTSCVIEYCLSYDNGGAGILMFGATGTNLDHSGNVARYNLCWGNARGTGTNYGEITLGGNIASDAVYNNTCYSKPNGATDIPALRALTGTTVTGNTVRNNIFYSTSTTGAVVVADTAYTTAALLMQGNAYYGPTVNAVKWGATTYTSLATWRAAVAGQEQIAASNVGVLGTDPVLSSPSTAPTVTDASTMTTYTGLQLLSTSPVLQAGLDLNALFAVNPGTVDFYGAAPTVPVSIGADEQDIGANYVTRLGATAYTSANAATVTTPSFTPADSTLLVVYCSMGNGTGGASSLGQVSDSVNGTTGWVRLAGDASATGGVAEIWARDIGTGASMTVTYDPGGAGASGLDIIAEWYSNARPVASQPGATATNGGTTAYTTTVTTTVSGSIVAGALGRATDAQTVTANGMTTKLGQVNGTSGDTAALFRSTSLTGITGTLVLGFTNPAAGANRMALAEILPATTTITAAEAGKAPLALATVGTALKVAIEIGASPAPVAARGTAVKVVAQTGTAPLGLAAWGTAARKQAQTGTAPLAAATTGLDVKRAVETGSGPLGVAATGVGKHISTGHVGRAPLGVATTGLPGHTSSGHTGTAPYATATRGTAAKVAGQAGTVSATAATRGTAVKVTAQAGAEPVPVAGTAAGRKVAPQTGREPLAVTAEGTAVKAAPQRGPAPLAAATSGTAAKRAPQTGTEPVALSTYNSTAIFPRAQSGVCPVGISTYGTARKVAPEIGRAPLGVAATGTAAKRAATAGVAALATTARTAAATGHGATGRAPLGVSGTATGRKVALPAGTAGLVVAGAGRVVKRATPGGSAPLPLATVGGLVTKRVSSRGSAPLCLVPTLDPSKQARPVAGRALVLLVTWHTDRYTRRPATGATSRPATGSTARPATGATARPDGGETRRPYTGLRVRP